MQTLNPTPKILDLKQALNPYLQTSGGGARGGRSGPRCQRGLRQIPTLLFFFTLVTGPTRSLSLKLSGTRVYEPQIQARLGTTAQFCKVVVLTPDHCIFLPRRPRPRNCRRRRRARRRPRQRRACLGTTAYFCKVAVRLTDYSSLATLGSHARLHG